MRASFDYAVSTGQSIAGIYVDVEKAFARLCRALVLPAPESDEVFISRLLGCGVSRKIAVAVLVKARSVDAWGKADGGSHLQALLTEMHTDTWASCEYLAAVIALSGGTLAGNALGDLVFTAAMTVLLTDLRGELRQAGLAGTYQVERDLLTGRPLDGINLEAETVDVSYVDDTFIPVIAPAPMLIEKVAATMTITNDVFTRHGFAMNLATGKTEAVIAAHGRGADALKRRIAHELCNRIAFDGINGESKVLTCVSAYKHLGSKKGSTESMAAEVRENARPSQVWSATFGQRFSPATSYRPRLKGICSKPSCCPGSCSTPARGHC